MTVQCCKCKRVRETGRWSAPLSTLLQGDVSHTYCPACADECYIEMFSTMAAKVTQVEIFQLTECLDRYTPRSFRESGAA